MAELFSIWGKRHAIHKPIQGAEQLADPPSPSKKKEELTQWNSHNMHQTQIPKNQRQRKKPENHQ